MERHKSYGDHKGQPEWHEPADASSMIIPVRCFTCGKVLADKWLHYERMCALLPDESDEDGPPPAEAGPRRQVPASTPAVVGAGLTARGRILDDLTMHKLCCRRHFLTHVDLVD